MFRHELRLLLYQPLSYLFQLGFLAVLAASVFLIADFYATDEASIRLLLVFLPWVALILVPALAMRAWIEDHSDRSMELTLTLPVSVGAVVLGKFLAGYLVLIVTLLFTLPLVAPALRRARRRAAQRRSGGGRGGGRGGWCRARSLV